MRTRQENFNISYLGLAGQGFKHSMREDPMAGCAYRGKDNRRCAIGHLIPDYCYDPEFEGLGIVHPDHYSNSRTARALKLFEAAQIDPNDYKFYEELQRCHDDRPTPDEMKQALIDTAARYDLTVPEGD